MLGWVAEQLGQTVKASINLVDAVIDDIKEVPDAFMRGMEDTPEEPVVENKSDDKTTEEPLKFNTPQL